MKTDFLMVSQERFLLSDLIGKLNTSDYETEESISTLCYIHDDINMMILRVIKPLEGDNLVCQSNLRGWNLCNRDNTAVCTN